MVFTQSEAALFVLRSSRSPHIIFAGLKLGDALSTEGEAIEPHSMDFERVRSRSVKLICAEKMLPSENETRGHVGRTEQGYGFLKLNERHREASKPCRIDYDYAKPLPGVAYT